MTRVFRRTEKPINPEERMTNRQDSRLMGGPLTLAIPTFALPAPIASKSAPGRFVFGYFYLAKHRFAWCEFEQR